MKLRKLLIAIFGSLEVIESIIFVGILVAGITFIITKDKTVVVIVLIIVAAVFIMGILKASGVWKDPPK